MINNHPVIAIAPNGVEPKTPDGFRRVECSTAYTRALARAGAIPVLLCEEAPEEAAQLFDALVLSGGGDIDPTLFGETILNDTVVIDPVRDSFELPLIRAFRDAGKPILGICRGMQVINVALGGTLYQDLPEQVGFIHFDVKLRHYVDTAEGSMLRELFGDRFRVNSTHHQAVRDLAPGLRLTAKSPEGIVEAYEHETLPIYGTQFHPERMSGRPEDTRTPDFQPLFDRFVAVCREHAAR